MNNLEKLLMEIKIALDNTSAINAQQFNTILANRKAVTEKEWYEGKLTTITNLSTSMRKTFLNTNITSYDAPFCLSVPRQAFQDCSSLSSVSLPSCETIDFYSFKNCASLSQVNLITCRGIGPAAFVNCTALTEISLPNCIYIDNDAFFNCTSLTEISLPVCSHVGSYAFAYCSSLSQVSLPNCSNICNNAFYSCTSLAKVFLLGNSACSTEGGVFTNTPILNSSYLGYFGSIYVPASLYSIYITMPYWSAITSRIVSISE